MAQGQIIIRRKKTNETRIQNSIIWDENISTMARFSLIAMLSMREGWDYSVRGMATMLHVSKDTMSKYIRELEEVGYLKRTQIQGENGQFGRATYVLTDVPWDFGEEPCPKNYDTEPCPNFPAPEKPAPLKNTRYKFYRASLKDTQHGETARNRPDSVHIPAERIFQPIGGCKIFGVNLGAIPGRRNNRRAFRQSNIGIIIIADGKRITALERIVYGIRILRGGI